LTNETGIESGLPKLFEQKIAKAAKKREDSLGVLRDLLFKATWSDDVLGSALAMNVSFAGFVCQNAAVCCCSRNLTTVHASGFLRVIVKCCG
jgi:hypothetical protein